MTWTFDKFEPGEAIGTAQQTVDDAKVDEWYAIYTDQPDTRPLVPAGMAMLIVMHGYAEAVQPRPNGISPSTILTNVHWPTFSPAQVGYSAGNWLLS